MPRMRCPRSVVSGINLAIQDAVATANLLAAPLRDGRLTTEDLQLVQQRREWPTRMTQRVQLAIQNRVIRRVLSGSDRFSPPFAIRLLALVSIPPPDSRPDDRNRISSGTCAYV